MSETYIRLYSTTCAGDLIDAINADVTIVPNLNQIINDGTGSLRFIFETALAANEILQFDSILAAFVCPIVTSVPTSSITVDDTVSSNTTIWTSQQVTNALNNKDQLSELTDVQLTTLNSTEVLTFNGTKWTNLPIVSTAGGTVTNVSIVTANGVSGVVANSTSTPAITLTLGNIAPLNVTTSNLTINGTATGITQAMVGLSNVDNTSDINKPVSTSQQTALNLKANISGQVFTGNISATNLSGTNTGDQDLSGYELIGVAAGLDAQHLLNFNHGDIAHTNRAALNLVSGTNTGDQDLSSYALNANVALKANISGQVFTGNISSPTLSGINTGDQDLSSYATSASVTSLLTTKANISGQVFTGSISATNLSGTNTGDQTITLTGDVTGSGTGSFSTTLSNTTVVPGSYTLTSITVDSKGRIVTISNGSGGAGSGTVTSVGLIAPSIFAVTGSPVTTSGNLSLALNTQVKNTFFAGPATGVNAIPTFRAISVINGDISDLSVSTPLIGDTLIWDGTKWTNRITVWSSNIQSTTGTSVIAPGLTPPLVTAGTELASQTITPLSTNSIYCIQLGLSVSASTNNNVHTAAIFRTVGAVSTYIGGSVQTFSSGGNSNAISCIITDAPTTTLPVTYSIRYGTNAGTWYINRRTLENTYGGVKSGWKIEER